MQGCSSKPSHKFISEDEYEGYLNYKLDDWCYKSNCSNTEFSDLNFNFKLNLDIDLDSIESEFLILRQGRIYAGAYKPQIIAKNVCFCLDDHLTNLNMLAFILLDKTNKVAYKWYKKESYKLYDKNSLSIVLHNNGDYTIKFQ